VDFVEVNGSTGLKIWEEVVTLKSHLLKQVFKQTVIMAKP
jgi:hypothetical protein